MNTEITWLAELNIEKLRLQDHCPFDVGVIAFDITSLYSQQVDYIPVDGVKHTGRTVQRTRLQAREAEVQGNVGTLPG